MKLLPYELRGAGGRSRHLGALIDGDADSGTVIDLAAAARVQVALGGATISAAERIAQALVPADVTAFISGGAQTLDFARSTLSGAIEQGWEDDPSGIPIRRRIDEDLHRLPAVPDPPLLRDFMGFEQHLQNIYPRLGRTIPPEWYELPAYYKANPAAVGAHGSVVSIPSYTDSLDMEFEIAAVIGPGGVDISEADALDHVFGWTIYNDFSARAVQGQEMAVGLGPAKSKDFLGGHVLGPVLVTADEIADPYALSLTMRVNDEIWTEASTGDMHWRFEQMIARASCGEHLRAGEVIGSGTVPGGSAAENGRTLAVGDVIELHAGGLGVLRNQIGAARSQ